jgi:hypothetical protein
MARHDRPGVGKQTTAAVCRLPRVHTGSALEVDGATYDKYEVLVHDTQGGRHLVAAIEIVSPANMDRPEHRRAFVAKCAALLQNRVSVTILDLVTTRNFNLYQDLLELIDQTDLALGAEPLPIYAVACRATRQTDRWLLETWAQPLILGQPLPTLPLWLTDTFAVPLELEACYEETCRVLRIS